MRRFITVITVIAVFAAAIAVASPGASGAANATVEVDDDFFNPSSLTMKEDKTIDFDWVGEDDHDVYKQSGPGNSFGSGVQNGSGVLYSHKFRKPGNYVLACTLHDKMLMDLKVKKRRN